MKQLRGLGLLPSWQVTCVPHSIGFSWCYILLHRKGHCHSLQGVEAKVCPISFKITFNNVILYVCLAQNLVFVFHRQDILDGLKKNWEELHHQYQGLSVVTDTAPKKARKERMEAEMKQLERDIETIEKHKVIYIANPFF